MHTCHKFDPKNPPAQWVQDGLKVIRDSTFWVYSRIPIMVQIQPEWLDLPCQYSDRRTDPACGHCPRKDT